jgi:hypothetical protein
MNRRPARRRRPYFHRPQYFSRFSAIPRFWHARCFYENRLLVVFTEKSRQRRRKTLAQAVSSGNLKRKI